MMYNINKFLKIIANCICLFSICGIVTGINDPSLESSYPMSYIILISAFFSLYYAVTNSIVYMFFLRHEFNIIEITVECCLFYKLVDYIYECLWTFGGEQPTWYNEIPMSVFFTIVLMTLLMNVYIWLRNKIKIRFYWRTVFVLQTVDNTMRNLLGRKYDVLAHILFLVGKVGRIALYVIGVMMLLCFIFTISLFLYGLFCQLTR